jgi:dihydrofolate synthase/folylpolyglutamate synthase
MQLAAKHGEVLVVCGSIFLMSEARQALGIEEAIDSDNITKVAGIGLKKKNEEKLIREGKLLNNK